MLLLNEIINVDVACYLVCDFELIKTTNYLTAARHGHSKSIDSECRVVSVCDSFGTNSAPVSLII